MGSGGYVRNGAFTDQLILSIILWYFLQRKWKWMLSKYQNYHLLVSNREIFQRKRSDDRKYVCGSQATPYSSVANFKDSPLSVLSLWLDWIAVIYWFHVLVSIFGFPSLDWNLQPINQFPGKWYPILDTNSLIYIPYLRLNCLKTTAFTAAHTYIPYI